MQQKANRFGISILAIMMAVTCFASPALATDFNDRGTFSKDGADRFSSNSTIAELALDNPDLSQLVTALDRAGLVNLFIEGGPFTVFAPTNDAFDAFFAAVSAEAGADVTVDNVDVDVLTAVLLDHVVPAKLRPAYLRGQNITGSRIETLGGLTLGVDRHPLRINRIGVEGFANASNGFVYIIEDVLTEPAPSIADVAIDTPALSSLVSAVVATELVPVLDEGGPFTVFAPTNDAFAALGVDVTDPNNRDLVTAVLLDHVVVGEYDAREIFQLLFTRGSLQAEGGLELKFRGLRVNGIRILQTNVTAGNGIVHVIDGVLLED